MRNDLNLPGKGRVAADQLLLVLVGLGLRREHGAATLPAGTIRCEIRDAGDGEALRAAITLAAVRSAIPAVCCCASADCRTALPFTSRS